MAPARIKQLEEALQKMEQEFKIVLDNIPAVLFKGYLDGSIDLFDRKVEVMTGYSIDEFQSRQLKWTDLILEEDRENTKMIFIQALKGTKAYIREYRIKSKVGNSIWVHERSHIICDAGGQVEYVNGLFFDVTERKRLEEELQKSEREFRIVIDNIPAVLFKGYLDGSIESFDGRLEALTGYPKEEFLSRRLKWTDLILAEDLNQTKETFIQALKTNKAYVREYRIRSMGGNAIWVHERSHIICDAEGRVEYVSGLFFDITERKELEAAVAERNDQLREANARLKVWANELEQRNQEISILGHMGELLQSCDTSGEAYAGILPSLRQLFPTDSGALLVFNESRTLVEAVTEWGEDPPAEKVFALDECWALRRGRPHGAAETGGGLRCRHVEGKETPYLCVPLIAHGVALGLLHLSLRSEEAAQWEIRKHLAVRVAEHLGLALGKLKLQETLQHLSVRDPLTGLFNRRYMEESLGRELHRAERTGKQLGVIMLDIDHFKRFNDTLGHDAGDDLLRELSALLQRHFRGSDIACRYGGEEFTIIMQDVSLDVVRQRAEQLREAAKQLRVHHGTGVLDPITVSLGVAIFPQHGGTRDKILQAADVALYRAKQTGRDRICLAGQGSS